MPLDAPAATGWRAQLTLGFERRGDRTVLARRAHDGPLVVQKALHPEGEGTCHAIVVHPPAGLVGGDRLCIDVEVGDGAHALITTPGAAKWYRSAGAEASQHVALTVGEGGLLEWLPQESILHDGTNARIAWTARLAATARLVAWDVYCLGRTGSGERFDAGTCRLDTRLLREGRLAWIERGVLAPGSAALASPVGLAACPVFGTMVLAAPHIAPAWITTAREIRAEAGEAGVTALPGVLLARYRGHDTEAARAYFAAVWSALREAAIGRAPHVPRIWRT